MNGPTQSQPVLPQRCLLHRRLQSKKGSVTLSPEFQRKAVPRRAQLLERLIEPRCLEHPVRILLHGPPTCRCDREACGPPVLLTPDGKCFQHFHRALKTDPLKECPDRGRCALIHSSCRGRRRRFSSPCQNAAPDRAYRSLDSVQSMQQLGFNPPWCCPRDAASGFGRTGPHHQTHHQTGQKAREMRQSPSHRAT